MEVAAIAVTPSLFSIKHKQRVHAVPAHNTNTYSSRRLRPARRLAPLSLPLTSPDRQVENESVQRERTLADVEVIICRTESAVKDSKAYTTAYTTRSVDIDNSSIVDRPYCGEQHQHTNSSDAEEKENSRPDEMLHQSVTEAEYKVTLALTPANSDIIKFEPQVVVAENSNRERIRKSSLASRTSDDGSVREKKSVRFADSVHDVNRESSIGRPLFLRNTVSSTAPQHYQHQYSHHHQYTQHHYQRTQMSVSGGRRGGVGAASSSSTALYGPGGALVSLPFSSLSSTALSQLPAVTDRFVVRASLVLPRLLRDGTTVTPDAEDSISSSCLGNGQQRYVNKDLPADVILQFARVRLRQSDDCLYASC
jgi:hypothetical protein